MSDYFLPSPATSSCCALVIQMTCTHSAAMAVLSRLGGAHGGDRNVAAMASRRGPVARTQPRQALRRLRNRGSQTVRVEHVHVNEGGQTPCRAAGSGRGIGVGDGEPSRRLLILAPHLNDPRSGGWWFGSLRQFQTAPTVKKRLPVNSVNSQGGSDATLRVASDHRV